MTRVDFYILRQHEEAERNQFACRLIEKAFVLRHRIHVQAKHETHAQELDTLLWGFREESFLPHGMLEAGSPIQLGWGDNDPGDHHDLLINLALAIPPFFSRFERVSEVVCQQPEVLEASRINWKFYQHRGYPLQSHRL